MAVNSGHKSSNSIAISIPDGDPRPRSGSKGWMDMFRRRRKSGSNLTITDLMTNDVPEVEKPTKIRSGKSARRRSNSVQIGETMPISIPTSNSHEPLRIALAKRELVSQMSPSESSTPMSQLLSSSHGQAELSRAFSRKVGPGEFLQMYRNRRCSLDSQSNPMLEKLRQRKIADIKPPSSPLARDNPVLQKPTVTLSESKPEATTHLLPPRAIPDHVVTQSRGNRSRRLSVFSPPPDRTEEGRIKQLDPGSRHRRFSEPQGPKMEALRKLSNTRSKVFQRDTIVDAMSNFPKFTPKVPKNSSSSAASLGNLFGRYIQIEPAHYVIWKEGRRIEKILRLPCTEEEYLDPIEDFETHENMVFAKFLKSHRCYELMPSSAKLVILDSELKVTAAFDALTYNGIRSAPIWDAVSSQYIGMLTVTDFIHILKKYHRSKDELDRVCAQRISEWREFLVDNLKPLVSLDSDSSLFEAVRQLRQNSVHRSLVSDEVTNEALYILTNRRIVHFVWYFFQVFHLPIPEFMQKSVKELNIGTYTDLASVSLATPLIDVLDLLIERRLSVVPVLDSESRVVNVYGKFDVMNLVTNENYMSLDRALSEELNSHRLAFEGLYCCSQNDSLATVVDRIVKADVHRLIVVDEMHHLEGIVSLSDVVSFLVLQQSVDDIQPGDVDGEMKDF